MITQDKHRLKYQAKTGTAIPQSPITPAAKFNLPINAIVHFMAESLSEFGMKGNNTVLHNWENEVFLDHVLTGYGEEGKPKILNISSSVEQTFFKNQTRLRRVRRLEKTLLKPKNLVVLDYSLLPHKLRYTQGLKQFYFEFINIAQAYVNNIETAGKDRENYIMVNIPDLLPAKSAFAKIKEEPSNDELGVFNEPALFWLRELWLAADSEGVLSKVNRPEHINFLLYDDGSFVSLNLGLYLSHAETKGSTAQKALLGLLEKLLDSRTPTEESELPEVADGETLSYQGVSSELRDSLNDAVSSGVMTEKEKERFVKVTEATLEQSSPIGDGAIKDAVKEIPDETALSPDINTTANKLTVDKSDTLSTTTSLTRDYVNNSLDRDVLKSILSLNKIGVIVKDVKREMVLDAANDNSVYIINYVMPNGKSGTRRLRIPNVKPSGIYKANNVEYTSDFSKVDKN